MDITDQEIDNLKSGRELDRLIAQHVFGLTLLTEAERNIIGEWESRRGYGGATDTSALARDVQNQIRWISNYSTEIRAAFEIVELWLSVHALVMTFRPGPKDWWVIFPDECGHPEGSKDHGKNCFREAFGETPELAICRAALKMAMKKAT